jgi:hypothetical protein
MDQNRKSISVSTNKRIKDWRMAGDGEMVIPDGISKMPERIPSCVEDILFHIHPECQKNINDHRGSDRQAGDVDEILSDGECRDPEDLPHPGTNPECFHLNKVFEIMHVTKISVFQINQGSVSSGTCF